MKIRIPSRMAACVMMAALCSPTAAHSMQADVAEAPQQLVTALHVHSTASSGEESLAALMQRAAASGIDALVLNENFAYEFRYAPRLLRLLGEARIAAPTLEDYGLERYLTELEAARRRQPDVLLLAGVEVPPYYYWSGSLPGGDLTLHDMQRNLLILPPAGNASSIETARFIAGLPAVGNRLDRRFGWQSLTLLVPGLLLVALSLRRLRRRSSASTRSPTWLRLIVGLAGTGLLWMNFPFDVARLQPYDADAGFAPAQRLIDYTGERGGLAFWSMPEAADNRDYAVGPVSVHLSTRPYPEALAASSGFAGFAGIYADTTRIWEAGGAWDRALRAYQGGERDSAPWLVGESAYHYAGQAGKQLGDVLTVLLVDEPTEVAAFRALAAGRAYALRRDGGVADLRLRELALVAPRGGRDGGAPAPGSDPLSAALAGPAVGIDATAIARLGDTLLLPPDGRSFDLVLSIEEATKRAARIQVEVLRNGEVTHRFEGSTPLRERWSETLRDDEVSAYYRIVVRGERPSHLVSNPVFVRRDNGMNRPAVSR